MIVLATAALMSQLMNVLRACLSMHRLLPVDGTEEAWELLGTSFQIDMQVKVRVHKVGLPPKRTHQLWLQACSIKLSLC